MQIVSRTAIVLRLLRKLARYLLVLLFTVALATFIKMFVIDLYEVPSGSMESSIYPGDYILISKTIYGPRWPESPGEIPWFNALALNNFLSSWFHKTTWNYKRWPQGRSIMLDDIIVFDSPMDKIVHVAKRCKGLPGDLIEMRYDTIYLNGCVIAEPKSVCYEYTSKLSPSQINFPSFGLTTPDNNLYFNSSRQEYEFRLHPGVANIINSTSKSEILKIKAKNGRNFNNTFGPVLIPKKGLTVNLKQFKRELGLYKYAIETFEGGTLEFTDDAIIVNGEIDSLYTFQNDYYFFLGDNRDSSQDSREWGFVPDRNVIGCAILVLFSKNQEIEDHRLFTTIR